MNDFITKNLMVKMLAGSHAYGTNTESSDIDYRGIFHADPINILTPFFSIKSIIDSSEEDTSFLELSHFMKLCLDCNPNVIELLWTDFSDICHTTKGYEIIRSYRSELLSSKIKITTGGYAYQQIKRLKSHKKWINNPMPTEPPQEKDYVTLVQNFLPEKIMKNTFDIEKYLHGYRLVPYGNNLFGVYVSDKKYSTYNTETGSLNTTVDDMYVFESKIPLFIIKFIKEEYKLDCEKHKNYWTWKYNRNPIRSALEEKYQYDSKHAMHAVRLLKMSYEALTEGVINVKRPDAQELLDIRNGSLTYDELMIYVEHLNNEIEKAYLTTDLIKKPDIKLAARLLMDVQEEVWYGRRC